MTAGYGPMLSEEQVLHIARTVGTWPHIVRAIFAAVADDRWSESGWMRTNGGRAKEREFLAASIAVWREIDRLSDGPGGYQGLDASTALRQRERAAWEAYRAILDSVRGRPND